MAVASSSKVGSSGALQGALEGRRIICIETHSTLFFQSRHCCDTGPLPVHAHACVPPAGRPKGERLPDRSIQRRTSLCFDIMIL